MYLVFEGIRDYDNLLGLLFGITDLDVQYAPGILGIMLSSEKDADIFLDNPGLQELDDTPEGFWAMSVEDDDYFLDRCEEAFRRHGRRSKKTR